MLCSSFCDASSPVPRGRGSGAGACANAGITVAAVKTVATKTCGMRDITQKFNAFEIMDRVNARSWKVSFYSSSGCPPSYLLNYSERHLMGAILTHEKKKPRTTEPKTRPIT